MGTVEFEPETNFMSQRPPETPQTPGMVNAMVKTGVVKSHATAYYILFGVIAVCIVGAIVIYSRSSRSFEVELPRGAKLIKQPGYPPWIKTGF
ncbi:MAG: hypothetical protein K0S38_888 [Candidatus Paceibacter sp.]|jgi:hypothetical protein|nr:hypothetical protein [Candidatus Paceibacter sp.]